MINFEASLRAYSLIAVLNCGSVAEKLLYISRSITGKLSYMIVSMSFSAIQT